MNNITIYVSRTTSDKENKFVSYEINTGHEEATVLEALQTIQEEIDPTLAFRYGCRFKQCGLCAMKIDGRPLMACMTKIKDGMTIEPLDKIPIEKDVIVERKFILEKTRTYKLYRENPFREKTAEINLSYEILNRCTDCQSCLSLCPNFHIEKMDEFAGPLFFVKLAQLQFHPLNETDYTQKAEEMGVEKCADCTCRCPYGIPIKKLAIEPFIDKLKEIKE